MKQLFIYILLSLQGIVGFGQISKLDTITDTKVEPFNQLCYQEIYRDKIIGGNSYQSTGCLLMPNIIITAAHNVYSNSASHVSSIKIFPGRYKEKYAYDTICISGKNICSISIKTHPKYKFSKKNRINWDFALIIIPDSIIKKTKNWPTKSNFVIDETYTLKQSDKIYIAGYPASHGYKGDLLTYQTTNCGKVSEKTFEHDFDTQTGNSGSPVWVEVNGKRIIIGVHTFGNAGTKLDKENLGYIIKWLLENNIK